MSGPNNFWIGSSMRASKEMSFAATNSGQRQSGMELLCHFAKRTRSRAIDQESAAINKMPLLSSKVVSPVERFGIK